MQSLADFFRRASEQFISLRFEIPGIPRDFDFENEIPGNPRDFDLLRYIVSTYVSLQKNQEQKSNERSYKLCRARQSYNNRIDVITINMISSTTSSDDDNNNVSLSVVQTVKKWIRNSWPFATAGKIDERRPDDVAARQEGEVLYIHQDECASVDDTAVIDGDRRDEEKCRDDNEASGGAAAFEDYGSKEALSASLSNEQHDNENDDNKAGSRVMDIFMASSPKKYFLRSSRRRRSCRFQLDDDKIDVVARSSNDDESVMAGGHFGGLNNDGADCKASSMTNNHDDRSKQDYDDNDKQVDELAAPALPQDTTTTNHSCSWTQQEITSLRQAYQQSNPTSPTLWQDISTAMNSNKRRSASECQRKWFSLVATPKKRVGRRKNGRVNDVKKYGVEEDGSEEEDDLFDSTPLKCAVQEIENDLLFQHQRRTTAAAAVATTSAATAKQEELEQDNNNDTTFHSPNKIMTKMMIKSPLSKRPRMFSPKNKNSNNNGGMKNDGILSPLINRRKGYNTYVNNLRREIGRAQKARRGDEKMSRDENIERCGNNSSRGGRGKGGGSTANKSSTTIRIKEGKGKSQLSAELDDGSFVLNIPQEDSDDENGSDVDLFEEVFRMEDEENVFS
eukprot:scaffold590_cov100-Skeletonema_dohrnii-CCMP3373.AAC.7